MISVLQLLAIDIGIDPELADFGSLVLTWHGVFTAVGIAGGVFVAVIVGRRRGFLEDDIYSAALVIIPAGIIGARALFVIERWGRFSDDLLEIFQLNEGGISIYGAVLGGLAGAAVYVWIRKLPVRRSLDVAALGALVGLAIGRIGDIINGEHFAETTGLPWGFRYTHLDSPSVAGHPLDECRLQGIGGIGELCTQQPAVAYELIGDLLIFGLLLFVLFRVRRDGLAFFGFIFLYSLMRFGVSELRLDSREIVAGLTTPQVTALFLIPMALAGLIWAWRRPASGEPDALAPAQAVAATGPPSG